MARSSVAGVLFALLAACSESNGATSARDTPIDAAPAPDAGDTPTPDAGNEPWRGGDRFAKKAAPLPDDGILLVAERPLSLRLMSLDPDRELLWLNADRSLRARQAAPAGRALLDATVHPSGEVTALVASKDGFGFVRYSRTGEVIAEHAFVDPEIMDDAPKAHDGESRSPIEESTHDVGRLDADGEGFVLATRTGRHSVIGYRIAFSREAKSFTTQSRTLVVPAHVIMPVGLTGGTYDTFAQLEAHFAVHVARGADGIAFVAVQHARAESGEMVEVHEKVFGEKLVTDPDALDIFVTRIAPDGKRLGTSVVGTADDDQLYGLRAVGNDVYALGRTEHWNEQGTGFEALVGRVESDGKVSIRELGVDRGDIAFDLAPAPGGGLVVVGASGYSQNPHGASISEESSAFALWLGDGDAVTPLVVQNGPRHNEARVVLQRAGGLSIGGMHDGPGTHSADADETLIRARGFLMPLDVR